MAAWLATSLATRRNSPADKWASFFSVLFQVEQALALSGKKLVGGGVSKCLNDASELVEKNVYYGQAFVG